MFIKVLPAVVAIGLVAAALSCDTEKIDKLETIRYSHLAMQGKEVFARHECDRCHYIGDEEVQADAPDLTDPMLANDSLFIRTHLKFVDASDMPPITLTAEESRQVSYFISHLHASKQAPLEVEADEVCSVCFAPVSKSQAKELGLFVKFVGRSFYFECDDCERTFKKAPEAFIEMLRRHEIDLTQELSKR